MTEASGKIWNNLNTRHRNSALIVGFELLTTIVLTILAWFFAGSYGIEVSDNLQVATILTIVMVGLMITAIVLRRMRFSPKSLQSIAVTRGISALLANLQTSTILLASLGGAVAVLGFIISLVTHDKLDMVRAAIMAIVILLLAYPQKATWGKLVTSLEKSGVK